MKATIRLAVMLALSSLASGCGWLSPGTAPKPDPGHTARTVELSSPDSTLAQIKEAFRVGSQPAYMLAIADSISPANPDRFTALFDFNDRTSLGTSAADAVLLNGGWHTEQERNALQSVMIAVAVGEPDTGRCFFYVAQRTTESSEVQIYSVTYRLKITLGNTTTYEGTAQLTFKQITAAQWKLLRWEDTRLDVPRPPPTWGKLRFSNRS